MTITKHRRENVAQHLITIGERVKKGWERAAAAAGLELQSGGLPSLSEFHLKCPEEELLRTFFTEIMLEKGYLAYHQFKPSFAHQQHHIQEYLQEVEKAFLDLAQLLKKEVHPSQLKGGLAQQGFYRLT